MSARTKGTARLASGLADAAAIERELARLDELDLGQLRVQFRNRTGRIAPVRISRHLLVRVLAYRIQADAFGALRADVRRMLDGIAAAGGREGLDRSQQPSPALVRATPKPGTVLAREWQGHMEQVMVLQDGFAWRGATYASLSAVALAMTGTKWNGHRFFGLRDKTGPSPEAEPSAARAPGPARVGSTGMRTGRCGPPEPARGVGQKREVPVSDPLWRSAGSGADR